MGLFKRANWHSGLTYEQTCDSCKTVIRYTDHKLDFRPWYADGFVYCPKCEKPLRHREEYAIDKNNITEENTTIPLNVAFCGNCGNKLAIKICFVVNAVLKDKTNPLQKQGVNKIL